MMNIAPILIDLPKASHPVRDFTFWLPKPVSVVLHFVLEGEFSAGEQAHGDIPVFDGREAAREALEFRGYERLPHFGGAGRNEM
jgi:hypothetical protein